MFCVPCMLCVDNSHIGGGKSGHISPVQEHHRNKGRAGEVCLKQSDFGSYTAGNRCVQDCACACAH